VLLQQGQVIMLVSARHKTICEKQLAQSRHLDSHLRTKTVHLSPIATLVHFQQVEAPMEASRSSETVAFILTVLEGLPSADVEGISVSRFLRDIWESDHVSVVGDKVDDILTKFRIYSLVGKKVTERLQPLPWWLEFFMLLKKRTEISNYFSGFSRRQNYAGTRMNMDRFIPAL
jgi:hypothetical protein